MGWFERLWSAIGSRSPNAVTVTTSHRPADHEAAMLQKTRAALNEIGIRYALTRSGYAEATEDTISFVRAALWDLPFPKGIDLRKSGNRMSADELRQAGMRANAICSREFYSLLTLNGQRDPIATAQSIVSALVGLEAGITRVTRAKAAMGVNARIQVHANNMAAGPCPACLKLASKPQPISKAPTGPLPDCPHPDQCSLHWRAILDWE